MAIGPDGTGEVKGYKIGPGADLEGADLNGADLRGADLRRANLAGADLRNAKLKDAKLQGARLTHAYLTSADLTDADLYGVSAAHADLCGADLSGVNLNAATLTCADLCGAYLEDADLTDAELDGTNFTEAQVEMRHVPLIQAAAKKMLSSMKISASRTPNPGQPLAWGPYHDSYYDHPSVRDHVALRITPAGRRRLESSQGPSFHLTILERLSQVPSLPQFVLEGELGETGGGKFGERSLSGAAVNSLCEEGLIEAFIEDRPPRPRYVEPYEYSYYDNDLEYLHREMLRHRRYGR